MISEIVVQTNKYANEIKGLKLNALRGWTDAGENDIWLLLGLELLMGIVRLPSFKDYWSTNPLLQNVTFAETMSRNRYEFPCFELITI
jgi:Transposase IS4